MERDAQDPPGKLIVASYNIHQCIGGDGLRDVQRVADVIRELKADVVALQEVHVQLGDDREAMQLDTLARLTGLKVFSGPTIHRVDGHYGNAMLVRRAVKQVRRYDLSYGRSCEPRGALDVELAAGPRIIATHLGLRPGERRFQVRRLLEIIESSPRHPLILLGDLNEWLPWGRPARWLHGGFAKAPARRTCPARFPLFPLDRILVRPAAALGELQAWRSDLARVASDHLPLRAEILMDEVGGGS